MTESLKHHYHLDKQEKSILVTGEFDIDNSFLLMKEQQTWQAAIVLQPQSVGPFILSKASKTPPPSLLCIIH